jgi:cytochrome b involved in lipid metabolism
VLVGAAFVRFGSQRAQAPVDGVPPYTAEPAVPGAAVPTPTASAEMLPTSSEAAPEAPGAQQPAAPNPAPAPAAYTAAQVAANASAASCWTIVAGSVYNVTPWINRHPGGSSAILGMCGRDATTEFSRQHGGSAQAQAALASFRLGALAP